MVWHSAWLSVGSNLGDKVANCQQGVACLASHTAVHLKAISQLYKTAPVDDLDQDWFINLAVSLDTTLTPLELLHVLQDIQTRCGRMSQKRRFGPRVLDLDIIFYDDLILHTPELTLPHPRMQDRRFVLQPLADLDARLVHPVLHQTVGELLAGLTDIRQTVELFDLQ